MGVHYHWWPVMPATLELKPITAHMACAGQRSTRPAGLCEAGVHQLPCCPAPVNQRLAQPAPERLRCRNLGYAMCVGCMCWAAFDQASWTFSMKGNIQQTCGDTCPCLACLLTTGCSRWVAAKMLYMQKMKAQRTGLGSSQLSWHQPAATIFFFEKKARGLWQAG